MSSDGFFYFVKLKKNNSKTFFKVDAEGIISIEFKNKEKFAIKWFSHQHQHPQKKTTGSIASCIGFARVLRVIILMYSKPLYEKRLLDWSI